ncbi:hypothetical protein K438DRAFT_512215 [Mycena galopus ATCC 62051]|nr:hypothetical protein K438DRAFT_512215 [Mycena galopus ATCC 62051]
MHGAALSTLRFRFVSVLPTWFCVVLFFPLVRAPEFESDPCLFWGGEGPRSIPNRLFGISFTNCHFTLSRFHSRHFVFIFILHRHWHWHFVICVARIVRLHCDVRAIAIACVQGRIGVQNGREGRCRSSAIYIRRVMLRRANRLDRPPNHRRLVFAFAFVSCCAYHISHAYTVLRVPSPISFINALFLQRNGPVAGRHRRIGCGVRLPTSQIRCGMRGGVGLRSALCCSLRVRCSCDSNDRARRQRCMARPDVNVLACGREGADIGGGCARRASRADVLVLFSFSSRPSEWNVQGPSFLIRIRGARCSIRMSANADWEAKVRRLCVLSKGTEDARALSKVTGLRTRSFPSRFPAPRPLRRGAIRESCGHGRFVRAQSYPGRSLSCAQRSGSGLWTHRFGFDDMAPSPSPSHPTEAMSCPCPALLASSCLPLRIRHAGDSIRDDGSTNQPTGYLPAIHHHLPFLALSRPSGVLALPSCLVRCGRGGAPEIGLGQSRDFGVVA